LTEYPKRGGADGLPKGRAASREHSGPKATGGAKRVPRMGRQVRGSGVRGAIATPVADYASR